MSARDQSKRREELIYNQSKQHLQDQMISYAQEMKKRGYLREKEIAFLKSGVIFNVIKLVMFQMRPDNLLERK